MAIHVQCVCCYPHPTTDESAHEQCTQGEGHVVHDVIEAQPARATPTLLQLHHRGNPREAGRREEVRGGGSVGVTR